MERVLSFMSLFANSLKPKEDDKVHPLLQELLEFLLDVSMLLVTIILQIKGC